MSGSAGRLERAGADFLIMPCNTAHCFIRQLSQHVTIPFLDMIQETVNHIENTYGASVCAGLLATDGAIKSGLFDLYFKKTGIKLVKPGKTQRYVMELIYEGVKNGNVKPGAEGLLKAIKELGEKGAEIFILGCTELSSAREICHLEGNFVDPLEILAQKSIEYAGGELIHEKSKKN